MGPRATAEGDARTRPSRAAVGRKVVGNCPPDRTPILLTRKRKVLARRISSTLEAGFSASVLQEGLRGRRVAIKQALLAGDLVVGVGNIYASEALFLAGIDPRTPAGRVSLARCERLVDAVRRVLARALELGGSTLRDFRDAHGAGGAFQHEAKVYGRAGAPCTACGAVIQRLVQGQRSTYYCPRCQKR